MTTSLLSSNLLAPQGGVIFRMRVLNGRRVTAYDLHATLRHLADWPTMPRPSEEATSLFTDLPDERTCETARVPAEWCLETPQEKCHARFEQHQGG